ncbi:MAG: aldo/keto reductase, partial [Verrucomicrobia bacterium]|nr:aldo/keto reductase [Verrucomicrobiota bacterium]
MNPHNSHTSRRNFLKSTLALPVAIAAAPAAMARVAVAPDAAAEKSASGPLPMRKLGKTDRHVTMLNIGGMMGAYSPQYLDIAWAAGIRYFDTADCYIKGKSEKTVGEWLAKHPERREELFLVSKDHPKKNPTELLEMIDRRLEACGAKYLDAFYIHGLGEKYGDASLAWPKSDEFKRVADKLKSSGKVKMVGFSCHDGRLNDYLNAAAQGGFVDIIMLKYSPFFTKGDEFDRALDACHAKGIALVAMKTLRT